MLHSAVIDALVASGITVAQLATAMKADNTVEQERIAKQVAIQQEKILERRANGRERQRRHMEKLKGEQYQQSTDTNDASVTVSDCHPPLPPCPPSDKEKVPTPLKEINSPLNPPTPTFVSAKTREFEQFWEIYPNRVGKKAAAKAFICASRRAPFEKIIAGLEKYVAKTDDRPWCNPATWLNQDRWDDEPEAIKPTNSKPILAKPLNSREQMIADIELLFPSTKAASNLGGSLTLVASNSEVLSGDFRRLDTRSCDGTDSDPIPIPRKRVVGDSLPLDRDACEF